MTREPSTVDVVVTNPLSGKCTLRMGTPDFASTLPTSMSTVWHWGDYPRAYRRWQAFEQAIPTATIPIMHARILAAHHEVSRPHDSGGTAVGKHLCGFLGDHALSVRLSVGWGNMRRVGTPPEASAMPECARPGS